MARTIQSPGVEINEIDLSLRPDLPAGTNILVPGFSPAGPLDEVLQVASLSEFEQIYGLPTNAAERYFYHTVKSSMQSQANVFVSRLPYGANKGDNVADGHYSAVVYPVQAKGTTTTTTTTITSVSGQPDVVDTQTTAASGAGLPGLLARDETHDPATSNTSYVDTIDEYVIGEPEMLKLNEAEYKKLTQGDITFGQVSSTSLAGSTNEEKIQSAGIVILNHRSLTINEKFEGYYVGIVDSSDFEPSSDYDSITGVKSINKLGGPRSIPSGRLAFSLDTPWEGSGQSYVEGTVSEVFENLPSWDLSTPEFDDALVLGLFKLRKSTLDPDTEKLDYVLSEYHIGSLNSKREQFDPNGGGAVSFGLEDVTSKSNNFQLFVNPAVSNPGDDWVDRDAETVKSKVKMTVHADAKNLYAHGVYKETADLTNQVGAIPTKLERVFELMDNHELFPLDLTLESGLATVFAATNGGLDTSNYDDEAMLTLPDDLFTSGQKSFGGGGADEIVVNYRTVANVFVTFAEKKRKDHMCIIDPLRHIFVQGVNGKVLDDKTKNFSQHVYHPLRHTTSTLNSSYGATYGNWAKVFDGQLGRNIWVPMSGFIGAMYANTDSNFQPWFAPAGFTRGVLTGVSDLSIYPKQQHRDQLYKINVNPVANFPNDGFVVFGQKTLQAKPSAFDRVNVRRLFLYLEKATRATVKYFVFEPNTLFTRTQVANVLAPIFDRAKNTQGMYDYLLICDERNNTPDVIDQNEMVIDIYIKPVRAAEFILVNFYATRTGQDFSELVS